MNNQIIKHSPSNIAIVKYWGKHGNQLPNNPSISFTLSNCFTETKITYNNIDSQFFKSSDSQISLDFFFEGKENQAFKDKIEKFILKNEQYFSFLKGLHLNIESRNSFPHSSGIASSASSMSALVMCLLGIKYKEINVSGLKRKLTLENFKVLYQFLKARSDCKKIIKEFNPDVVIGTGGYICGPVFAAATANNIPSVLHESNAYPGKALKMFSNNVGELSLMKKQSQMRLLQKQPVT